MKQFGKRSAAGMLALLVMTGGGSCVAPELMESQLLMAHAQEAAVASIDATTYSSLKDAMEAAESGNVITVLADINEPELSIGSYPYLYNDITLDLNQHTVTLKSIDIMNHFTVENGTLNCAIANSDATSEHILTLNQANVNTPETEDAYFYGVGWGARSIKLTNGSHLKLTGGTLYFGNYQNADLVIDATSDVSMTNVRISFPEATEEIVAGVAKYLPNGYFLQFFDDDYGYYIVDSTGNKVTETVLLCAQASSSVTFDMIDINGIKETVTVADLESYTLPHVTLDGYDFNGWNVNGTLYNTEASAKAAMNDLAGSGTAITLKMVYAKKIQSYAVSVSGGKLSNGKTSSNVQVSNLVTVKANAPVAGKKFSHWIRNGVKVSSNSTYSFHMPSQAVNLEAVFVNDTTAVQQVGTAIIESVKPDAANQKISFVSVLNVPKNGKFVKGGLVATQDAAVANTENYEAYTYKKLTTKATANTKNIKYTWTKGGVTENTIWYVRAYLVYKDSNGATHTVYGDTVSAGRNGLIDTNEDTVALRRGCNYPIDYANHPDRMYTLTAPENGAKTYYVVAEEPFYYSTDNKASFSVATKDVEECNDYSAMIDVTGTAYIYFEEGLVPVPAMIEVLEVKRKSSLQVGDELEPFALYLLEDYINIKVEDSTGTATYKVIDPSTGLGAIKMLATRTRVSSDIDFYEHANSLYIYAYGWNFSGTEIVLGRTLRYKSNNETWEITGTYHADEDFGYVLSR